MSGTLKFFLTKVYKKTNFFHLNLMSHIIIINNIKLNESICLVPFIELSL